MGRALIVIIIFAIAMWGAFTMLPGCAAVNVTHTRADVEPIYQPGVETGSLEARSLMSDPAAVRRYIALGGPIGQDAWYHDRNDYTPGVYAGIRSPVYLYAETYTYDRQHASGRGHVRDHVSQTTRRVRVIEGVR